MANFDWGDGAYSGYEGTIKGNPVQIAFLLPITEYRADAIVVPQFHDRLSLNHGSTGDAVANSGGGKGVRAYEDAIRHHLQEHSEHLPKGGVVPVPSGGGIADTLLHVVCNGGGNDEVRAAMYGALKTAEMSGMKVISVPPLCTGAEGSLSLRQSATAMMETIDAYKAEGGQDIAVRFVLQKHGRNGYPEFVEALRSVGEPLKVTPAPKETASISTPNQRGPLPPSISISKRDKNPNNIA